MTSWIPETVGKQRKTDRIFHEHFVCFLEIDREVRYTTLCLFQVRCLLGADEEQLL